MPNFGRSKITHCAAAAAFAIAATMSTTATPANAHGAYKDRAAHSSSKKSRHARKHEYRHGNYRRRDRAVFAHEVDLKRPGGVERFFELLSEENR